MIEAVSTLPDVAGMQRVTINPHRDDTFVLPDGAPVGAASRVVSAADPPNPAFLRGPGYGWIPCRPPATDRYPVAATGSGGDWQAATCVFRCHRPVAGFRATAKIGRPALLQDSNPSQALGLNGSSRRW